MQSRARIIASHLRIAAQNLQDGELLQERGSRNAAYLLEQAAEHLMRAIATSENIHISRADAHQLDKIVRQIPNEIRSGKR